MKRSRVAGEILKRSVCGEREARSDRVPSLGRDNVGVQTLAEEVEELGSGEYPSI